MEADAGGFSQLLLQARRRHARIRTHAHAHAPCAHRRNRQDADEKVAARKAVVEGPLKDKLQYATNLVVRALALPFET